MDVVTFATGQGLPGGNAPDWVHLLPLGHIKARDGRTFTLDAPEAIIAQFDAKRVDLPVDYEHQTENPLSKAFGAPPAAGWIKGLELRPDGIWGRVAWTAKARKMIEAREYRYVSPALSLEPKTKRVIGLKSAALVHAPALELTALAHQEQPMDPSNDFVMRVIQALGLNDETSEDDVLTALEKRLTAAGKPDPRKYVPIEALQDILEAYAQEKNTDQADRIKRKVDEAFSQGYLTGPMRDWATALCQTDEAAFDAFIASSVPAFGHLLKPTHTTASRPPETFSRGASDPQAEKVAAQLGISVDQLED